MKLTLEIEAEAPVGRAWVRRQAENLHKRRLASDLVACQSRCAPSTLLAIRLLGLP